MDAVLDMTAVYGKIDWTASVVTPPRPRFRGRPRVPRRRAKALPYRAVPQQGRRDRGAAGRYRWACRLWRHTAICHATAANIYAQAAAMPGASGSLASSAVARMIAGEVTHQAVKAHVLSIFETSEAISAAFVPRFSRVDETKGA